MVKQEFYFQWHICNTCNLRCKHCYQKDYEFQDVGLDALLHIARDICITLKKWNMLGRIALTGGEPFMSPHLFDLLTFFENNDSIAELGILTNGTDIGVESIGKLQQYRKLREIQISLDGATAETHDAIRGYGVYEQVVETIHQLKNDRLAVSLMFTLMKSNLHEAIEVIDFAEKYGINATTVERVTPCGNSTIGDILTAEEVRKVYFAVTQRANEITSGLRVRRTRPLWNNTQHLNCLDTTLGGFCPVGLTALSILHDGTVLPCRRLNIPIGNLFQESIIRIWYGSEVLWKIRDKKNLKGKCGGCDAIARCGGCRAVAFETTGDYMGEDIQCWK